MTNHHHHGTEPRARIAWIVFAAVAAFYLWTEHRAHLLGVLPFLVVLACPLMHLFMHHGHGHHGHQHGDAAKPPADRPGAQP